MRRTNWILMLVPFAVISLTACGDGGETPSGDCSSDAECSDGNACNGAEACVDGACVSGTPATDGSECLVETQEGFCVAGACQESVCGDGIVDGAAGEECDDQNEDDADGCTAACLYTCVADGDCDDGQPCNGAETCEGHACVDGTPMDEGETCDVGKECLGGLCTPFDCGDGRLNEGEACDDGNAEPDDGCEPDCTLTCEVDDDCADGDVCTADSCESNVCVHTVVDGDDDGLLCGDDCDDSDASIGHRTWYADCDDDGYAPLNAAVAVECDEPAVTSGCLGWTSIDPDVHADCRDALAEVNPGAAWHDVEYEYKYACPPAPACFGTDWDYDCNGSWDLRWEGLVSGGKTLCSWEQSGLKFVCTGRVGWTDTTLAPSCGEPGVLSECKASGTDCIRVETVTKQQCK